MPCLTQCLGRQPSTSMWVISLPRQFDLEASSVRRWQEEPSSSVRFKAGPRSVAAVWLVRRTWQSPSRTHRAVFALPQLSCAVWQLSDVCVRTTCQIPSHGGSEDETRLQGASANASE